MLTVIASRSLHSRRNFLMFRFALGVLLSGSCLAAAEAKTPFKVQSTLDISYVTNGGAPQTLDIFCPEGQTKRPVVLLIHGGSWMIGDKNFFGMYRDVAVSLAR